MFFQCNYFNELHINTRVANELLKIHTADVQYLYLNED